MTFYVAGNAASGGMGNQQDYIYNTRQSVQVVQFNQAANRFDAVPIDLGLESDRVFLVGFGSGLRNRSGNSNLCNIGGTAATVTFLGAQSQFVGLDQANILLPRSLAGRGNVDVALIVDGKRTNAVAINIR